MELLLKVVVGILAAALIIIGIMVICFAAGSLWAYIQNCLYDEWGFELPPKKSSWHGEWVTTGKLTSDVVPVAIMKCEHCDYKTIVMSRCCPNCGKYMDNWNLEWNWRGYEEKEE